MSDSAPPDALASKGRAVEEPVDLRFFRPLGMALARALRPDAGLAGPRHPRLPRPRPHRRLVLRPGEPRDQRARLRPLHRLRPARQRRWAARAAARVVDALRADDRRGVGQRAVHQPLPERARAVGAARRVDVLARVPARARGGGEPLVPERGRGRDPQRLPRDRGGRTRRVRAARRHATAVGKPAAPVCAGAGTRRTCGGRRGSSR